MRTGRNLLARVRRWLRPPRRLRPTRAGWSFFAITFGVGFAALNTGNNLLYLVLALMLSFLVLSGVLSESALRGIAVRRRLPRELYAGAASRVVPGEVADARAQVGGLHHLQSMGRVSRRRKVSAQGPETPVQSVLRHGTGRGDDVDPLVSVR